MQKTLNWNTIYTDYSPKLLGICRRYVSDLATAEDLVQDSFISAIQNQTQLKNDIALFGWLKKIVVNNALQYLRKNGNQVFNELETEQIQSQEEDDEADFLSRSFTTEDILSAIDQLPAQHKAVFNLFFLENYSHEEISKELEININTSKSHLSRAKKNIKTTLMEKHTEPSTLKRKGIQLLVFLGFGNLLWAKNLQSGFSNFKIPPKKDFQNHLDNAKPLQIQSVQKSTFSLNRKLIFSLCAAFGFILIILNYSIFSKEEKPSLQTHALNQNQNYIQQNQPKESTLVVENNNISENKKKPETRTSIASENNSKKTPILILDDQIKQEKVVSTTEKPKTENTASLDSSSTAKKPVVVVKKIIKRDTIYVTK